MRHLLLASALSVLPAQALAVEWHVGVVFGDGKVVLGDKGLYARIGDPPYKRRHERRRDRRYDSRRHDYPRYEYRRPIYVLDPAPTPAVEPRSVEKPAAEVPEVTAPVKVAAPDPRGAASRHRARGVRTGRTWSVGEFLPPSVPHVKLDARRYDLPPEPDGQIYARVRGDLLLIDAVTRRVEAIVPDDRP